MINIARIAKLPYGQRKALLEERLMLRKALLKISECQQKLCNDCRKRLCNPGYMTDPQVIL